MIRGDLKLYGEDIKGLFMGNCGRIIRLIEGF